MGCRMIGIRSIGQSGVDGEAKWKVDMVSRGRKAGWDLRGVGRRSEEGGLGRGGGQGGDGGKGLVMDVGANCSDLRYDSAGQGALWVHYCIIAGMGASMKVIRSRFCLKECE